MHYTSRTLAPIILQVSETFPVLLLTGPRQVGKTTLLEDCAKSNRRRITLDDFDQRALAQRDPTLFLQTYSGPIIIDEIQYAPELFNAIKIIVDREKKPGMFWLTGSQKFHLMQGISETLAGRVAILDLLGLSQAEKLNRAYKSEPFLPTPHWIEQASSQRKHPVTLMRFYEMIWLGSFPALALNTALSRDIFYSSYIQTYIQRDVRALAKVGDEMDFERFLRAAAARTGQLLNYNDMARDVGVNLKTIKSWISILETSGLIYLLPPYHNITNRLIKTPKLYFLDTGLCAYLTRWSTPEALEAGAMTGSILETYILTEILKSYWHHGKEAHFYFYRDRDQKEIDLLIEQDGQLYPIEFKKTAQPSAQALSTTALEKLGQTIGPGAIICLKNEAVPLSKNIMALPLSYL